jgi:hypothetical protein
MLQNVVKRGQKLGSRLLGNAGPYKCLMKWECFLDLGLEKSICHLEACGRPKLVRAVLCGALPGRPETQLREKAGWGQRYMAVGPGYQWVGGGPIRTVWHLQGPSGAPRCRLPGLVVGGPGPW